MKKWGLWGSLLLFIWCLNFAVVNIAAAPSFKDKIEIRKFEKNNGDKLNFGNIENETIIKDQIYQGNLLLVNDKYPVHQQSIKSDVVNLFMHKELIEGYVLLDNNINLSADVAHKFSQMVAAAEKEGVGHFAISSGFRDFDEQRALYQKKGPNYALPAGYSEHNLGLSLDVASTQMKMSTAPEGKWIEKNAWKYGFILRYPKDKTDVTGIQYEPWHIRYVGFPHSAIMQEKNLALEEYLDYLKEEKAVSASVDGEKYEVSYYPVVEDAVIHVPTNLRYEISGNNIDGVIVTVFP